VWKGIWLEFSANFDCSGGRESIAEDHALDASAEELSLMSQTFSMFKPGLCICHHHCCLSPLPHFLPICTRVFLESISSSQHWFEFGSLMCTYVSWDLLTVLITVSFKRRSIVYFYQSPFHSRILAVLIQTSDQTLNTLPQVSVEHEERGRPPSVKQAAVMLPPKEQRERWSVRREADHRQSSKQLS